MPKSYKYGCRRQRQEFSQFSASRLFTWFVRCPFLLLFSLHLYLLFSLVPSFDSSSARRQEETLVFNPEQAASCILGATEMPFSSPQSARSCLLELRSFLLVSYELTCRRIFPRNKTKTATWRSPRSRKMVSSFGQLSSRCCWMSALLKDETFPFLSLNFNNNNKTIPQSNRSCSTRLWLFTFSVFPFERLIFPSPQRKTESSTTRERFLIYWGGANLHSYNANRSA